LSPFPGALDGRAITCPAEAASVSSSSRAWRRLWMARSMSAWRSTAGSVSGCGPGSGFLCSALSCSRCTDSRPEALGRSGPTSRRRRTICPRVENTGMSVMTITAARARPPRRASALVLPSATIRK